MTSVVDHFSHPVQVANTWTKITARDISAMVRNGNQRENPNNSSVAATLEKAITYVFAGSPFRNAEARSSTLLCSTIIPLLNNLRILRLRMSFFHMANTWTEISALNRTHGRRWEQMKNSEVLSNLQP